MQEMTEVFAAVEQCSVSMVALATNPRADSFSLIWSKTRKTPPQMVANVEIAKLEPAHLPFVLTVMRLAQADAQLLGARGEAATWQKLIDKLTPMP